MRKNVNLLFLFLMLALAFVMVSCKKQLSPPYEINGNKLYFGSYPQTKETNEELISKLNKMAGTKPTTDNCYNWIDYNYYSEGSMASFMFYQDIDYDKDGHYDYRGVYFTQYRPSDIENESAPNTSQQDNNGYFINEVYWFKYEKIEWDILFESEGEKLIIANLILDSQYYYPSSSNHVFEHNGGEGYVNNYELSYVRKFLNDDFYNTAFNKIQKELIQVTELNNSDNAGVFACNNTNDKIFLLSYSEAFEFYENDESRKAHGTDYAIAQGLIVHYKEGNSPWILRTPIDTNDGVESTIYGVSYIHGVCEDGSVTYTNGNNRILINRNHNGLRPVCWVKVE